MNAILEEAKKPENQEFSVKRIPKEVLEGARFIGGIRRGFRGMLETYVPQVGYSAPKNPRILDLGCGPCYEAHVLSSYFGGEPFGFDSDDVLVVGIDIDGKEIEKAEINYTKPIFSEKTIKWIKEPNYKFIHGCKRIKKIS
jgi:SAM-dependent methyltransferase